METRTVLLLASSHNCIFVISSFPHYAGVLSIRRTLKPFYNDAIYCSPFCSPCLGTIGRSYQEREWKTAQSNREFPEDDTSSGNESQLIRPNSPLKRLQFIIPPAHPKHGLHTGHISGRWEPSCQPQKQQRSRQTLFSGTWSFSTNIITKV